MQKIEHIKHFIFRFLKGTMIFPQIELHPKQKSIVIISELLEEYGLSRLKRKVRPSALSVLSSKARIYYGMEVH